jgi:hypothetical protein
VAGLRARTIVAGGAAAQPSRGDVLAEARLADPLRLLLASDALAVAEVTEIDLEPSPSPAP